MCQLNSLLNQEDSESDSKFDESCIKSWLIGADGSWQLTNETCWKATGSSARRLMKSAESAWSRRKCSVPPRGGKVPTSVSGCGSVS